MSNPIIIDSKMKYWKEKVQVVPTKYHTNGKTALLLRDPETGEPIAHATVNMEGQADPDVLSQLPDTVVFIKDYSENEGVLITLINAAMVIRYGTELVGEFVTFPAVNIIDDDLLQAIDDLNDLDEGGH